MIKVLIVDDEPTLRKGLISKIDWRSMQLECAGEAADGLEALELVEACCPEVMIVDIRMPEMDGLALIAQVKERVPDVKCIIVSGYSDFDYAREAIKYGVTDYLVKPVDDQALHEVLLKLKDQILQDKKEDNYRKFLEQQYDLFQDENREHELSRLVNDTHAYEKRSSHVLPPLTGENARWMAAVIRMEPFTLPYAGFHPGEESLLWFGLRNIVEEQMGTGRRSVVFKHSHQPYDLVVLMEAETGLDMKRLLSEVLNGILRCLKLEGSVGIGEPADVSDVSVSYHQAVSAVKTKILKGSGCIYDHAELRQGEVSFATFSINSKEERLLYAYLDDKKEAEMLQWLSARFHKLASSPQAGYPHMEQLYIDLDAVFRKYLTNQIGEPEILLDERKDLIPFLTNLNSWRDALAEIQKKAESIMKLDRERGQLTGDDIVAEVKQYIDRHYNENLSLKWVAEHYYIHPNYFSKLFKERCGENFNDYLTKVRLSYAEDLLRDPAFKIGRIAHLVGYKDSTYFSSVFKRVYGVTPIQYREQTSV